MCSPSTPLRGFLLAAATALILAASALPAGAQTAPPKGSAVVTYAERFLGRPYRLGATGPRTFDCSGFVQSVYRHFGMTLPRTSWAQMTRGRAVRGPLKPGDLLFWAAGGHVGIYTGDQKFISATVHKGIAVYSLAVWRRSQSFTTARRLLTVSKPAPPAVDGGAPVG